MIKVTERSARPRSRPSVRRSLLAVWLLVAAFVSTARAHDPYDSWSSVTVFPDRIELAVTLAQSTALRLVDPDRNIRGLTLGTFEKHRAVFERHAPGLYVLTAGRKRLVAGKSTAELTDENDVIFKIEYPRPPAGPLHFHAAFLVVLGEGYGGLIDVSENTDKQIGWEQLSWANPNFEVILPAPAKSPPAKK